MYMSTTWICLGRRQTRGGRWTTTLAWSTASAASARSWLAGAASIAVPPADSGVRASALALGEDYKLKDNFLEDFGK